MGFLLKMVGIGNDGGLDGIVGYVEEDLDENLKMGEVGGDLGLCVGKVRGLLNEWGIGLRYYVKNVRMMGGMEVFGDGGRRMEEIG